MSSVPPPGRTWYYDFKREWLDKDFRPLKSVAKDYKRANAERRADIEQFFRKLKALYEEYKYLPCCIWAGDETGLEGDAASRERILVPKTLKLGEQIKGSFRDHVSAMHICNALGIHLPPIFSFIGKLFNPDLLNGAPEGSKLAMQDNGYFEQCHVKAFLEHIIEYMDSHPELYHVDGDAAKPRFRCLLILDGASTHVSAEGWEFARVQLIDLIFLPPNLTHLMQVSDVGVFGPFKTAYRKAAAEWRHHHRRDMDKYDIAAVTAIAWKKAMTEQNALSGFRKTGQWPYDPSAVLDKVPSLDIPASPLCHPLTPSLCCVYLVDLIGQADEPPPHP